MSLLTQTSRRCFELPYRSAAVQSHLHSNENDLHVNHFAKPGAEIENIPSTAECAREHAPPGVGRVRLAGVKERRVPALP
jgi:hypothetical protein